MNPVFEVRFLAGLPNLMKIKKGWHKEQKWFLGQRVRVTMPMAGYLKGVPKRRQSRVGFIEKVYFKFGKTYEWRRCCYEVRFEKEFFGEFVFVIIPGDDNLIVKLLKG